MPSAFDFCQDTDGEKSPTENLGQVLFGERIRPSPYKFKFDSEETCKKVCEKKYSGDDDNMKFLKHGMMFSYEHHWIIDNMPVTWCYPVDNETHKTFCSTGIPMGCFVTKDGTPKDACVINTGYSKKSNFYLFNHHDIVIYYHDGVDGGYVGNRLISARLNPKSYKSGECKGDPMAIPQELKGDITIPYTYSIKFVKNNDVKWASRWDYILDSMPHTNIQVKSTVRPIRNYRY